MKTLVILESNRGTLHRLSKEAIVAAQNLGGEVYALAIGKDADIIASELENVQLKEVLTVKNEFVESYNADGFTEIISQVIRDESPENIMLGHTYQTRDFAPRLSAKLDIPFKEEQKRFIATYYSSQYLDAVRKAAQYKSTFK